MVMSNLSRDARRNGLYLSKNNFPSVPASARSGGRVERLTALGDFFLEDTMKKQELNPSGLCMCGCGRLTSLANQNDPKRRYVKGEPKFFVRGHNMVKNREITYSAGYIGVYQPSHPRANAKGYVPEHVLICAKALGRPLPVGAVPHHWDHNPANNTNPNLVICQNQGYHLLLHRRERALKACGHASWRKCTYCKQYGDPQIMQTFNGKSYHHKLCLRLYERSLRRGGLPRKGNYILNSRNMRKT